MLELRNISKNYGDFELKEISIQIQKGEYFILLGRSGAGKSQLLEIISGLRKPDRGEIILNGRDITRENIQERKVGLVFQDFALFPHLTVFDNISYPLKMKKMKSGKIVKKVGEISDNLNVKHLLDRKPDVLSGGEKQRVAVARTLVTSPDIILLDEPMSSIDTPLRDDIRRLLRKINQSGMTILHVTHDHRESIRLAHRVGVIHNGRIIQIGHPVEVFAKPANRFVARFAGIQNFFKVDIIRENSRILGKSNKMSFVLPDGDYNENGIVMLKSDRIEITREKNNSYDNCVRATVNEIYRTESGFELYADAGEIFHVAITEKIKMGYNTDPGQTLFLCFTSADLQVI